MEVSGAGAAVAGAAAIIGIAPIAMKAQAPAAGGAGARRRRRRAGLPLGAQLFTAFDADKDGAVTAAELKTAFDAWYDAADSQKSGIGDPGTALDRAERGAWTAAAAPGAGGRGAGRQGLAVAAD